MPGGCCGLRFNCAVRLLICLASKPNFSESETSFASSNPEEAGGLADIRIVPSRWSLTMIGAMNSAPSRCG